MLRTAATTMLLVSACAASPGDVSAERTAVTLAVDVPQTTAFATTTAAPPENTTTSTNTPMRGESVLQDMRPREERDVVDGGAIGVIRLEDGYCIILVHRDGIESVVVAPVGSVVIGSDLVVDGRAFPLDSEGLFGGSYYPTDFMIELGIVTAAELDRCPHDRYFYAHRARFPEFPLG